MKFWIGVTSDGTEIMSKFPIKRYFDYNTNEKDVLCYKDTQQPPHWMLDFTGRKVGKSGWMPVDEYITLPQGSLKRMFGVKMTWDDEFQIVDL